MYNTDMPVALASNSEKALFYRQTYTHLAMAVLGFIFVEGLLLNLIPADLILAMMGGKFIWLFILGVFWLASMLANRLVFAEKRSTQYAGLAFYVLLEAIIFLPMIFLATVYSGSGNVVLEAAVLTLCMFGALSFIAFTTKSDLSFLRSILIIGGFVSIGLIALGAIFGFDLGLWFSVLMVALASGSILYQTQQLKSVYSTDQYVGAALQLFASVMLLFWYILRILMRSRD
ncbi:Bax inhibitor-1 family protein [Marinilongibacter aquaticus]|uniref:Bax inhibitor-1/YccA family protein n=1 Tax=Marinilongibacter aquaticus TaxID=2975157 RepID=UPI0021BD613D|nr:Bax inhibitor-1 family protein [Marinilongibacter aquaticus]UBM60964.1 Bax inhibitor-1 family protein [Marinilongibacter aquaticus]